MFGGLSTVTGLLAAGLWFYASMIKVPTDIESGYGKLVGVKEMSAGFKKQAIWNSYAAVMTAVAVGFQAVGF
jgi:hypothetical protein